jgi:hypothetical protein
MSEDIKKYKQLVESSFTSEAQDAHMDADDPAHAAELVHHMFSGSSVDKHTLKDVLMGHKNDPAWALETLRHLENKIK